MAAPYHNLRSKLDRAIVAYLISAGAGSIDDVLSSRTRKARKFPNTTVKAGRGVPDPPYSGNYRVTVYVSIKYSATQEVKEPNPGLARTQFDQRVAQTFDALMQSDNQQDLHQTATLITAAGRNLAVDPNNGTDPVTKQEAENNADMADFTIMQWIDQGFGSGPDEDAEGNNWEEVLMFEALCCPSNVD